MKAYSASRLEKSQVYPWKSLFKALTSFSTWLPLGSKLRLTPMMSAPASAKPTAIDLPIPRLHPVTKATFPFN